MYSARYAEEKMSITSEDTFEELTLTIESDSSFIARCYRNRDREVHRRSGPAIIFFDGTEMWYLHDKRHREDGPAITWADGRTEYWLYGKRHYRV